MALTKQELLEKLAGLDDGDREVAHLNADSLLIQFINDPEITKAYERIDKWYS